MIVRMPSQPLDSALGEVRALLLDRDRLVGAVAAGRRAGQHPSFVRVDVRPVQLKSGPRLQVVTSDGRTPHARNFRWTEAAAAVEDLLAEPFGSWHVQATDLTLQLRVTKKGLAQVHRSVPARPAIAVLHHDRTPTHLIDPGDPLFRVLGANAAKRRQVDAFLQALAATMPAPGQSRAPLRVVDLGCGNAYLTFAAYQYLRQLGHEVELTGIDVRADQRSRNTEIAGQLGWSDRVRFIASTIADAQPVFGSAMPSPGLAPPSGSARLAEVDVVLSLHACDTATDEALERAVAWRATTILAAPCCHRDLNAQLRRGTSLGYPAGRLLTRYPILRERFADVLTDTLRAALLRLHGYRVDVVEFVESAHTARNVLIRAQHTAAPATEELRREYSDLASAWGVTPRLATLLGYDGQARLDEFRRTDED